MNYVTKPYTHSATLKNASLAFAFSYLKINKQLGYEVQHKLCPGIFHDVIFICLDMYRSSYQLDKGKIQFEFLSEFAGTA